MYVFDVGHYHVQRARSGSGYEVLFFQGSNIIGLTKAATRKQGQAIGEKAVREGYTTPDLEPWDAVDY